MGHHPADDVTAEDVEHDVQVEVGPVRRAEELSDVPAPQLVRGTGEQLGSRVTGMPELVASLADLEVCCKDPVHGALRAEVSPLIEQGRIDLGRGEIHESRFVEYGEDCGAFRLGKRPRRTSLVQRGVLGPPPSVVGRP
jgi:hypothetical protein